MMDFIHELWWRPKIGDPTFMGWLTVVAYGLAAFTSWLAAFRAGRAPGLAAGSRMMWLLVAMLMAALCINKQLDLQSLFTDIGRVISKKQGWYEERREFQKWFVMGVLGVSFLATVCFFIRFRRFWESHFLLASGLMFLLTFIVVRAISFHHVDMFLKHEVSGVRMNWFLELTGIGLIWLAAMRDWRNPRRISTRPGREPGAERSRRS